MAHVLEKIRRDGGITYCLRFRVKDKHIFEISFDDKIAAFKWMEENEDEIYLDPEKFIKWRGKLFYEMQEKKVNAINHIRKPKPPKRLTNSSG